MREEFEALVAGGEHAIRSLLDQQETVTLEFKCKEDPTRGDYSTNDKQQLARELSAFSNSIGGILIWGVRAAKNQEGVDCAGSFHPIREVEKFKSQTIRLCAELLMPKNEQILVGSVGIADDPSSGFLVVSVERSERRPHRSEAKGQKTYFKRSGDSAYAMEHFDIEDAFSRKAVPTLDLGWEFTVHDPVSHDGSQCAQLDLFLENKSNVSARFPYLNLGGLRFLRHRGAPSRFQRDRRRQETDGGWARFLGSADDVINPGQRLYMASVFAIISPAGGNEWRFRDRELNDGEISFDFQLGCLDAPMRAANFQMPNDQLRELIIQGGRDLI